MWWNIEKVLTELRTGNLHEKDQQRYLLNWLYPAFLIVVWFALDKQSSVYVSPTLSTQAIISTNGFLLLLILIAVQWSIRSAYKAHKHGGGKHFIECFIYLGGHILEPMIQAYYLFVVVGILAQFTGYLNMPLYGIEIISFTVYLTIMIITGALVKKYIKKL